MANIQTPIRMINVKETYEEVCNAMESKWLELTEKTYFYARPSELHEGERKIRLNRDYIIEVQP